MSGNADLSGVSRIGVSDRVNRFYPISTCPVEESVEESAGAFRSSPAQEVFFQLLVGAIVRPTFYALRLCDHWTTVGDSRLSLHKDTTDEDSRSRMHEVTKRQPIWAAERGNQVSFYPTAGLRLRIERQNEDPGTT